MKIETEMLGLLRQTPIKDINLTFSLYVEYGTNPFMEVSNCDLLIYSNKIDKDFFKHFNIDLKSKIYKSLYKMLLIRYREYFISETKKERRARKRNWSDKYIAKEKIKTLLGFSSNAKLRTAVLISKRLCPSCKKPATKHQMCEDCTNKFNRFKNTRNDQRIKNKVCIKCESPKLYITKYKKLSKLCTKCAEKLKLQQQYRREKKEKNGK
jgi:hypothetical protein